LAYSAQGLWRIEYLNTGRANHRCKKNVPEKIKNVKKRKKTWKE